MCVVSGQCVALVLQDSVCCYREVRRASATGQCVALLLQESVSY